jgi:hypothetical protein
MPRTIYGAELIKSPTNATNNLYPVQGKNSEAFTAGDICALDGTNGVIVLTATLSVVGIADKTVTMSSSNQTVAKVIPPLTAVTPDMEFLMGTNSDLTVLTSPGVYYGLTGTTGAQQVDVSSGAVTGNNRMVVCVKVDPFGEGGSGAGSGLRQGIFKFVKVTAGGTT